MASLSTASTATRTVSEWLKSINLGQYCEKFESEGYDDLEFLVKLNENEVKYLFIDVGMSKSGHIVKFKKSLFELQSQPVESGSLTEEPNKANMTKEVNRLKMKSQSTLKLVNGRLVFSNTTECGVNQKKTSNPWDCFLIPNAHSKRLLFFNDITKDIYNSAFTQLQSRFKHYLDQQRFFRWGVNKDITQLDTTLKFSTNDGLDLNVKKYQKVPPRPVAVDVQKAKSTMLKLSSLEEKLGAIKYRLQERIKNELYDCNHVPKQWAGSEISYINQHVEKLETLNNDLICLHSSITNTWKLLSARFNQDTVLGEERKRITRRRKEQRKKARQRKKNMGKKQAYKLILKIHGEEFANAFLHGNSEKVSAQKLGSVKLLPRFHIKAIEYLIAQGTVDDIEEARRLLDVLLARKAAAKGATTAKSKEERTRSLEPGSDVSDSSEVNEDTTETGHDVSDSFEVDEDTAETGHDVSDSFEVDEDTTETGHDVSDSFEVDEDTTEMGHDVSDSFEVVEDTAELVE